MNLVKFQVLVLIARLRKVSAVADKLSLSQPTISFHMKSLEKEYGVPLFYSSSSKMLLTEAGQALYHYAAKMLSLSDEAGRVMEEFKQAERGSLRIGASSVPATYVLPGVFAEFQKLHPNVRITLVVKTAPVIDGMLEQHEVDAGVLSASDNWLSASVQYERLCDDRLVLACSPLHPLASREALQIEDVATQEFILHEEASTTRVMSEEWAVAGGFKLRARLELGSSEAIKKALVAGLGVSILSRTAIAAEVAKGELWCCELPGDAPKRSIYLGRNPDRLLSPLLGEFMRFLKERLQA